MTDLVPSLRKDRKIRVHRKSRQGCGNCKLRRVKCDEGRPGCKRCAVYSILCNYDGKHSDLQLSVDGAFNMESLWRPPQSQKATTSSVPAPSWRQHLMVTLDSNPYCPLYGTELELLRRFQQRTVCTVSPAKTLPIYKHEIVKLCLFHPFLMHAAILLTLLHDRHLAAVAHTKLSTIEAFHYYQAIALFNSKLSGPLQGPEGDALWAASAILDAISFCHVEAKTPEEAWPLKPPSFLDLNWLSLSEGKLEVWRKTSPNRPDGIFRLLALEYMNFPATISSRPGLEVLPLDLILLCGLDASSTANNNPYYAAALSVARSLDLTCDYTVNLSFTMFIMRMPSEYKHLLAVKDPRALLLLAYWYAKVCQYEHWWIVGRAALECQAICMFLERYHGNEAGILRLLRFPKTIAACFARGNAVDYLTPYLIE